jgi:tRNA-2-methylthio-N6-dimethylallyladenosine synthase
MNFNDSEIVSSLVAERGYSVCADPKDADVILLNTCSVRDNAEKKIYERLTHLKQYKKRKNKLVVGVLGCMAERLQEKLLQEREIVNLVAGPDEYRKIPELLDRAFQKENGIAVLLSEVETYEDITPLRTDGVSAYLAIMRGCNNFCSYCVVPYTRGRERSRSSSSIIDEVIKLRDGGFKELTLLGQNVNSYKTDDCPDFPALLAMVATTAPTMRIRFITSHPKDMSDKLLETMAAHDNICKFIHLPIQSGSNRMLKAMNRKYTVEHYLGRIARIRELLPDCALSTDIIAGYPGETLQDHAQTMELINKVRYDGAFMFRYSPREGTKAFDQLDDVDETEKLRRLNEIINLQHKIAKEINSAEIGRTHIVIAEGPSKRNSADWQGRSDTNKIVIFPNSNFALGDTVKVRITRSTAATLYGDVIEIL